MISTDYVREMAAYNRWQNESLYEAASTVTDDERRRDRGAFFRSIHETLNHVLWGDQIWLSRLAGSERPAASDIPSSVAQYERFEDLRRARARTDAFIVDWAARMSADDLAGEFAWFSKAAGRELTHARWLLVVHFFNHQTHHRGQVHAMLTAAGAVPEATDLPFMPR